MQKLLSILLLIAIYIAVAEIGVVPNPPFAGPAEVSRFMLSPQYGDILYRDCFATASLTLLSWFIGCICGIAIGILIALLGRWSGVLLGSVEVLRSIPSAMWIPFGIVLAGLGTKPILLVSSLVVFLFMTSEIAYSGHLFVWQRADHLKRLGLSWWERVRLAHAYEILTVALPSSRVAITISLIVVVIAEMQAGARRGLGSSLIAYQASQRGDAMVSIMLTSGILGLLLNVVMAWTAKKSPIRPSSE